MSLHTDLCRDQGFLSALLANMYNLPWCKTGLFDWFGSAFPSVVSRRHTLSIKFFLNLGHNYLWCLVKLGHITKAKFRTWLMKLSPGEKPSELASTPLCMPCFRNTLTGHFFFRYPMLVPCSTTFALRIALSFHHRIQQSGINSRRSWKHHTVATDLSTAHPWCKSPAPPHAGSNHDKIGTLMSNRDRAILWHSLGTKGPKMC